MTRNKKNAMRGKRNRVGDDAGPPRKKRNNNNNNNSNNVHKENWTPTVRANARFSEYYKTLGIIPESEWEAFEQTMVQDLPTTFRLTTTSPFFSEGKAYLERFATQMKGIEVEGQPINPPAPLSWYPYDSAWHVDASRGPLRKEPTYKEFHVFLTAFTDNGAISRQEAVSMIPPLLLDVEPQHLTLDMCAAPGSKTSQIIEIMHKKANGTTPTGVVVANDVDEKRCYLMIHQVNRLSSPCFIATQHQAQRFPFLSLDGITQSEANQIPIFDRILADVPCSGDGTLRKNYDLWAKWATGMGLGLHKIQVQIASRGVKLLKVGGRMVYSTCSLNPVEDEAVVAQLLRSAKGAVELVDVSDQLVTLKRSPGISSWKVSVKDQWYTEREQIADYKLRNSTAVSVFPPTEDEAKEFHLDRCLRILPHHQNTGGFFVAVLRKVAEVPAEFGEYSFRRENYNNNTNTTTSNETQNDENTTAATTTTITEPVVATEVTTENGSDVESVAAPVVDDSASAPAVDSVSDVVDGQESAPATIAATDDGANLPCNTTTRNNNNNNNNNNKRRGNKGEKDEVLKTMKEDPYYFLKSERWESVIGVLKEFYGLTEDFPTELFIVRSEGKCPRLYLVSESARNILANDTALILKTVNMGLRVFSKHSSKDLGCPYRMNSEGLPPIAKFLTDKRKITVNIDDAVTLLVEQNPHFYLLSDAAKEKFEGIEIGGVWFDVGLGDIKLDTPLLLSGWRGKVSTHLLSSTVELKLLNYVLQSKIEAKKQAKNAFIEQTVTTQDTLAETEPIFQLSSDAQAPATTTTTNDVAAATKTEPEPATTKPFDPMSVDAILDGPTPIIKKD